MAKRSLFPAERQQDAQYLITLLLKARRENGWGMNFQNELSLRALAAISRDGLSKLEVMEVLSEMWATSTHTLTDFESIFGRLCRDSWKMNREWTFHLPWPVILGEDVKIPFEFTLNGFKFRVTSWNFNRRKVLRSQVSGRLRHSFERLEIPFDGYCLTAKSEGRSMSEAWYRMAPTYDFFRGFLEFHLSYLQTGWSIPQKPKCKIAYCRWLVGFPKEGEPDLMTFFVDDKGLKPVTLESRHLGVFRKNAKSFRMGSQKDSMNDFLVNAFRLYSQAMDERFHHRAFLAWWQLAEALTLSWKHGGKTDLVVKRLNWSSRRWKLDRKGIADCFKHLADYRNTIVHQGIGDMVDEEDCNFLKVTCELLLNWMLGSRKRISDIHTLEKVYQIGDQDEKEFQIMLKANHIAENLRRTSSR